MKVSLITTERNEGSAIAEFINSALSQSLKPDEIIIADGGSTDGTLAIIKDYIKKGAPILLVNAPGNRSVGRNAATRAASNEIIAVTDVGSRLDRDWLKNITEPFYKNPQAMVVAGSFKAESKTFFEKVSSTLMLAPNDKIDLKTWLPSSRSVAYKKEAWGRVGGYPEHTNFNEDTPFDLALKKAGYKFENGLRAIVYWHPRSNSTEFFKQYYYYAVGDGIDQLNFYHFIKLSMQYIFIIAATALALSSLPVLTVIPVSYLIYLYLRRIFLPWRKIGGLKAFAIMLYLAFIFDISQIFGFWAGFLRRKQLRSSNKLTR